MPKARTATAHANVSPKEVRFWSWYDFMLYTNPNFIFSLEWTMGQREMLANYLEGNFSIVDEAIEAWNAVMEDWQKAGCPFKWSRSTVQIPTGPQIKKMPE